MWTKENANVWMQSGGISPPYYKPYIYEICKELWAWEHQCISVTDMAYISTTWSTSIMSNQCIDRPMCLFFQGIGKAVVEFSFALLVGYYQKSDVQKQFIPNDESYQSNTVWLLLYWYYFKKCQFVYCRLDCRTLLRVVIIFFTYISPCTWYLDNWYIRYWSPQYDNSSFDVNNVPVNVSLHYTTLRNRKLNHSYIYLHMILAQLEEQVWCG